MSIRVLLADDHPLTRAGVRGALEADGGFQVVAEAENGREAVQMAREFEPDVAILDISMPDLNGLDATQQILRDHPEIRILILSMHSDKRYVEQAIKVGAAGYLLKDCAVEEVAGAVRSVHKGHGYLSPGITGVLIEDYRERTGRSAKEPLESPLTPAEREVLQLLAEGKTSREIASALCVSPKTVEARRKQITDKLDLHTVAELTKYAIREGLTSLES
ncbi:MAG TPA: response regulator transcription factor [bacterium]|nr:response regulator transcription factor [bacterium]HPO09071.1 response regulator transcription factor [bacterium]HQO34273.1 response regulator transcription factor [bacterium]HQP97558.1 response regulator transcription factor [bacterium]